MEALASGHQGRRDVIAIVPDWFAPEGLRRLEMARALLDTARVAIHVTACRRSPPPRSPRWLEPARPRLPSAGLLAARCPGSRSSCTHHLARQRHRPQASRAEPRPARREPDPGQRVRRLLVPEPAVHKIQPGQPSVPLPRLVRPSRLVVAPRNGDEQWIAGPVNAALGNLPVRASSRRPAARSTGAPARSSRRWSSRPTPGGLASELLRRSTPWACRWCGELIARSPCPLCGHRARPRRRAPRPRSTGRSHVGRRAAAGRPAAGRGVTTSPRSK